MDVGKDPRDFFVAGGTLRADTPSYVERPADNELLYFALEGEFCYVLTPRQMGKSSLMIRTAQRLRKHGVRTVLIDLARFGTDVSADQWYLGILTQLRRVLGLSINPREWWYEHDALGYLQRFSYFLRDVVLEEIERRVVIFFDEIDTTVNLAFGDDFFAAIRAIYNARADDPEFDRVTLVLLGVASPLDLIKDRTRTPFNIGQPIRLSEFSQSDATVLRDGLDAIYPGQGKAIFTRIYHWTNGHPYLTQKLCLAVAETKDGHWTDERVDDSVERLFLSEEARKETNLQSVQDNVNAVAQKRKLLNLYRRVYQGQPVPENERSLDQNQLKLIGLVRAQSGLLVVRNEIYRSVFDLDWIKENIPVDWTRRIAFCLSATVLLLAGLVFYLVVRPAEPSVQDQAQTLVDCFWATHLVDERANCLSDLFELPGCEYKARELFFEELTSEDRLALFLEADLATTGDQLINVARMVYTHLDHNRAGNELLTVIAETLKQIDRDEIVILEELDHWLKGRDYVDQGNHESALDQYNQAISLNKKNIGTRFDRALTCIELGEYIKALEDLDEILRIVQQSPQLLLPTRSPKPESPGHELPMSTGMAIALMPTPSPQRFSSSVKTVVRIVDTIRDNQDLLNAFYRSRAHYYELPRFFSTPTPTRSMPTLQSTLSMSASSPTSSSLAKSPTPSAPVASPFYLLLTPTSTLQPAASLTPLTPIASPAHPTSASAPTPQPITSLTPTEEPLMPSPLLVKSTEDRVLLRAEPITESIPLALLEKGERLIVLDDVDTAKACIGEQGEWIKVQTTEGKNGYVAAWLVVQAPLGDLVVYPTVPLNVRAGPSTGTITLTTVFTHTGDGLMVLGDADIAREKIGREGRWLYVQAPSGEIGYVAAWYVYLGSLELDLWSLHARCDGRFWHQIIYIRGRMGDGVYTYYWNGQQLATLKNEGYEFEIPSSGEVISGTGSVVSGDGQRVERRLFIRRPECRGQP